jgi:hypothetical protein
MASEISSRIVSGAMSPVNGADLIAKTMYRYHKLEFHELDTFIYASSEVADRPEDRELFESAIEEEASQWAARRVELQSTAVSLTGC